MPTDTAILLRRSAIEAAKNCLFRYDAIWNKGLPDMSDYALRGIGFHAAVHRYILRLVEKQIPQDAEEAVIAFTEGMAAAQIPGRLVTEVRQLFDFWSEYFELDLDAYVTSEERQERSEQAFTPDLVYARHHELEIIDWKTFYTALTEAQAKADFEAQWYVRNAMINWPNFKSYRFTFAFVRLGKYVSVTFTQDELALLDRNIQAVTGSIQHSQETGVWPATPGPSCAYCTLQCPAVDQKLMLPKRIVGISQAEKIAAFVLAGEQMVRSAKKALKAYCGAYGPVSVQGVEFDNRPTIERRYPFNEVIASLEKRGVTGAFEDSAQQGLTISHSALKPLFKKFTGLESELEGVQISKTGFRFSSRKPGGDTEPQETDE